MFALFLLCNRITTGVGPLVCRGLFRDGCNVLILMNWNWSLEVVRNVQVANHRSPKNLSEKALGNEGATTNLLLRNDEIVPLCDALLWVPVGKVTNCANISLTSEGARAPIWIAVADYLKNLPKSLVQHLP